MKTCLILPLIICVGCASHKPIPVQPLPAQKVVILHKSDMQTAQDELALVTLLNQAVVNSDVRKEMVNYEDRIRMLKLMKKISDEWKYESVRKDDEHIPQNISSN